MPGHGGVIYRKDLPRGKRVLDFSANVNPLDCPNWVREVVQTSVQGILNYPDPDNRELCLALGKYVGVDQRHVVAGNGSAELIYRLIAVMKPRTAVVVVPAFSEYEKALRDTGAAVTQMRLSEESEFDVDLAKVSHAAEGKDIVFLCNPNSPTGRLLPARRLIPWVRSFKKKRTTLVIDEAFIDWEAGESLVRLVQDNPRLVVIRSLTKFFGLAGLRLGYAILPVSLATRVRKAGQPWPVNIFAQEIGKRMVEDKAFQNRSRVFLKEERVFLETSLRRFEEFKVYPSSANFLLFRLDPVNRAKLLHRFLATKGIFIRDCANFQGLDSRFIRIAVLKRKDNLCLLESIKAFLKRGKI